MDIRKSINEFQNSYKDSLSFLDDYHLDTNRDIVSKLTGKEYLQIRAERGAAVDSEVNNEHLFNIRDPNEIEKGIKVEQKVATYRGSYTRSYYEPSEPQSTINQYTTGDVKLYKNDDEITMKSALETTPEQYAEFFNGTTMLAYPEDMLRNRFSRFSRYGYIDAANEFITGTREYVFFSKPDLHLMDKLEDGRYNLYYPLTSNMFLTEAFNHYKYSFYSLQQNFANHTSILGDSSTGIVYNALDPEMKKSMPIFDPTCKYIPLLSNMITSTIDLNDITAGEVENNRNLYQINTTYREGSIASDLQYDFSTEFKDTKYLDVYMLFKIYDEYCRHKYVEEIEPTIEEYTINKIYPEAMSIWKVIVDDTDRIMYWAKAIGCTPMSVPRGSLSNFENQIKFTINWKAQFVRDMDPVNLMELNYLTRKSIVGFDSNPALEIALPSKGETWVGYPYIIRENSQFNTSVRTGDNDRSQPFYKLVWLTG